VPSDGSTLGPSNPFLDDGEFLIDTSAALGPAPDDQREPAIAFDGANFLVVWEDGRDPSGYTDIYGARVTPQGTVLDPLGFVIPQEETFQSSPALAFDGANFLVVWEDWRSGRDIYGARVTPGGVVLDLSGFVISQAADYQCSPALGFDGANFLVVWQDWRSGVDIYGARVTPGGVVLDPSGFAISQEETFQWPPALAFDGANFLVVWEDGRDLSGYTDIYGARVTPQGAVLDPQGFCISQAADNQSSPALGFDGANFLVAWTDRRSGGYISDIYGARVTPAGVVLDTAGIAISTAADNQSSPALGFDDANFLVVWQDGRSGTDYDIYGARVTPGGTVLDPSGFAISQEETFQWSPALAFDGTNFLVVWEDGRSGTDYDIYGARVTPAGVVLDTAGIPVSTATYDQFVPALAFDGTNFLVVWMDFRGGVDSDIYGARVTQAGVVLDTAGIAISQAANGQQYPALAFDGTNFLVVWQDSRGSDSGIYCARVTPAGVVLDPSGIAISTAANGQYSPTLGFDGANFLVVWQDSRGSGTDLDIYGARVTPGGTVLDPSGFIISQAASYQGFPAIAFDDANFLVAWTDARSGTDLDIYGARVTPAGVVLDTAGIAISTAADWQSSPALGFDSANFLVVWTDYRNNPDTSDIYGARMTPAGTVYDEGLVVRQEGNQQNPALAGAGSQMFLVYQGWAGTVGGKTYNTYRIWGKMNPSPAIAEMTKHEVRRTNNGATLVRGVLLLPGDRRPGTGDRAALLDISGRKVAELRPGANDVRALSPGVYFIREEMNAEERDRVTKVIVQH
jgi:hypothetical protein